MNRMMADVGPENRVIIHNDQPDELADVFARITETLALISWQGPGPWSAGRVSIDAQGVCRVSVRARGS